MTDDYMPSFRDEVTKLSSPLAAALIGGGAGYLSGKKSGKPADEMAILGAIGASGGSALGKLIGAQLSGSVVKGSLAGDQRRYRKRVSKAKAKLKAERRRIRSLPLREQFKSKNIFIQSGMPSKPSLMRSISKANNKAALTLLLASALGGTAGYKALTKGKNR